MQISMPTVREGDSGVAVQILQRLLIIQQSKYAPVSAPGFTGTFDQKTEDAVKAFQKATIPNPPGKISDDGVVGPKTWDKLSRT